MAKLEQKSVTYEIKAISTTDQGTVEALVSIFGNIDLGGDRIIAGAFTNSLQRWKASGDPLPFIWSHEWDNPEAHIGFIQQAEERPEGLWVKAQLDIDRPFAEQVFHLLKNRRITQFSFGYTVTDARNVKDQDGTSVRELLEVDIFEAGPTLLGMNPATQLLQAASALKSELDETIDESDIEIKAGESIVVSDIDGTIADGERPIQSVLEHLKLRKSEGNLIVIVTGRIEDDREATINWLDSNAIPYDQLHMNDFPEGTSGSLEFKVSKAKKLQEEYTILEWIENNESIREALEAIGVNAIEPGDVAEQEMDPASEEPMNENSNSQNELEQAARDSGAKISQDQIINLITRPQHSEE